MNDLILSTGINFFQYELLITLILCYCGLFTVTKKKSFPLTLHSLISFMQVLLKWKM